MMGFTTHTNRRKKTEAKYMERQRIKGKYIKGY